MKNICIYGSFKDLLPQYNELFIDAASIYGFFLSLPWFRNLIATTFDKKTILRIYGVEDKPGGIKSGENKPCMALAMCHQRTSHGLFFPRRLVPAANYYTSLFGPIIGELKPDSEADINLLAEAIAADTSRWDIVDLHPMDISNPIFDHTQRAFRLAGMAVQTYFCFGNWYLDVNGRSYHEYFNDLPAKLKNTLTRKTKLLSGSECIHFEIYSCMDNITDGIAVFEKIYLSSWKAPEPHPAFIPGLIRTCASLGWLRMGVAYVDKKPAAAQIWIVNRGVASIYKLAHDKQFSRLSAGTILTAHLMRHVIDIDRVREVDFLTGDDEYKRDWMSHRRERWGIMAFNLHTIRGNIAATKHLGGRAVKNILAVLKNLLKRPRISSP